MVNVLENTKLHEWNQSHCTQIMLQKQLVRKDTNED